MGRESGGVPAIKWVYWGEAIVAMDTLKKMRGTEALFLENKLKIITKEPHRDLAT